MTSIVIVGEAWGQNEATLQFPLVGASGRLLITMLQQVGILPREPIPYEPKAIQEYWLRQPHIHLTNVFNQRPENNDVELFCTNAAGPRIDGPALRPGRYIKQEFHFELERLAGELASVRPNLVIALGGTASWALLGDGGISRVRGAIAPSMGVTGVVPKELPPLNLDKDRDQLSLVEHQRECVARPLKVLPTFHPAAIMRDWSLRHVTVMDLAKASREAAFPDIRRPRRTVYVEPSLEDLEAYWDSALSHATLIAIDIETQGPHITCIGFAPSSDSAIVVPFRDNRNRDKSYWRDHQSEVAAWLWVKKVCESGIKLLFHNGQYDTHYLWKQAGICAPVDHDSMLLHHSLQPESKKGLGYLGACYTNEASWKLLNAHSKSLKKEA